MSLRVSGQNLSIGEALRGQIEARVQAALTKYVDGRFQGHVTIRHEGTRFCAECVLHLDSGVTLQAAGEAHDAYAAFGEAAEHIEKRLRRHKRRVNDRPARAAAGANGQQGLDSAGEEAAYAVFDAPGGEDELPHGFEPMVVSEQTYPVREFSVSDAVGELDLTGAPFIVFRHAANGRVNLVFRRPDGHIGWIDPPGAQPAREGGPGLQ